MVKRIKKVTKNRVTRERKRLVVVGSEGNNKSEVLYLKNIERKQKKYHFIFDQGNETDPVKIVRNTDRRARQEAISVKHGDMAVSIFDLDVDYTKEEQLRKAKELSATKKIILITSNPYFELWYLEHFRYTTKPFVNSNAVIQDLRKYIPDYAKNSCDFESQIGRASCRERV